MNNWNFLYEKIEEAKLRQKQEQQEDIDVKKFDEEIQDDIFERVDSIISAGNELEKDLMEVDAGMENNSEITHGEETDSEAFLYENNKKINNLIARNNELQMKLDRLQKEYENELERLQKEKKKISLEKIASEEKLHTLMLENKSNVQQLSLAQTKEKNYKKERSENETKLNDLQKKLSESRETIEYNAIRYESRMAEEKRRINTLVAENGELKKRLENNKDEYEKKLNETLKALKTANCNAEKEKTSRIAVENHMEIINRKIPELESQLVQAEKNSNTNYEILQAKLQETEKYLFEKKEQNENLTERLEELRQKLTKVNADYETLIKNIKKDEESDLKKLRQADLRIKENINSPFMKTEFLTKTEFEIYEVLKTLCETEEFNLCVKVRLANITNIKSNCNIEFKDYIKYRFADFVICDKNMYPIAAIDTNNAVNNDVVKVQIFDAIKLPYYKIFENMDLRNQLFFIIQDTKKEIKKKMEN